MASKKTSPTNDAAPSDAMWAARRQVRPPRILTYVYAVARHGSIRKAAETLNIASSALNRRILDLEEELGCDLFERLPRGVRLTAAGELFVDYVRRAIAELETVNSRIEQLRGLVRGRVLIAAAESVAGELPRAISGFQSKHPRVRFDVTIGTPKDLLAALVEDRVDLMLTHDPTPDRNIAVVTSTPQAMCALMVPDHPLAGRPDLRLRDCLGYPIALGDSSLAGRALIEQVLAKASYQLEPALVSNSVELMKAFSLLNQGICFQFRPPHKAVVPPGGMIALPLTDTPLAQAQLLLAIRRDRVLPFAAAAFVEHLKSFLDDWDKA